MSMRWGVIITYRGVLAGKAGVRKFRRYLRDALRAACKEWWARMLPARFRRGARGKFGFTPRPSGYDKFKLGTEGKLIRQWRGAPIAPFWVANQQPRDHVLSGNAQRESAGYSTVSGTYKKAVVKFRLPFYYFQTDKKTVELLKTTPGEARTLAKLVDKLLSRAVNSDKTVRRVKV